MRPLQLLQTPPALQQISHHWSGHVVEPLQDLRKIQFQAVPKAIALSRLFIHSLPAFLNQGNATGAFLRCRVVMPAGDRGDATADPAKRPYRLDRSWLRKEGRSFR